MKQDNSNALTDGDYTLTDNAAWFTAKGFSIRIQGTDEGVVVDVYPLGHESDGPIASTYAFDTDCNVEEAEEDN